MQNPPVPHSCCPTQSATELQAKPAPHLAKTAHHTASISQIEWFANAHAISTQTTQKTETRMRPKE